MTFWAFTWTPLYVPAWWWYGAIAANLAAAVFFSPVPWVSVAVVVVMQSLRFMVLWPPWLSFWV